MSQNDTLESADAKSVLREQFFKPQDLELTSLATSIPLLVLLDVMDVLRVGGWACEERGSGAPI